LAVKRKTCKHGKKGTKPENSANKNRLSSSTSRASKRRWNRIAWRMERLEGDDIGEWRAFKVKEKGRQKQMRLGLAGKGRKFRSVREGTD